MRHRVTVTPDKGTAAGTARAGAEPYHRVLVVDANGAQATSLGALLAGHSFDVTTVQSGEEALQCLAADDFDLVLSDVITRGMSGYEMCARVKRDLGLTSLSVVLMTSLSDPRDIIRGLECGADNYITKPYDPEYLVARLRQVIATHEIRRRQVGGNGVDVVFMGETFSISAERQHILDLCLSSYEELVRANSVAHAAERRSRFLAEASRVLASSLDYQSTLQSVARLSVPELADLCIVDMLEADGSLRRVAVVQRDGARALTPDVLEEGYPPAHSGRHPVARVLHTGQSEVVRDVIDSAAHGARNADQLEQVRSLGFGSHMVVPLAARERVLGVVSFIFTHSGRRYRQEDLLVAEDLARRAAMAIDGARLVDDLQRSREALEAQRAEAERARHDAESANRAKSEFLAMMSHELRTPLNAISGYAQLIQDGVNGPITKEQRNSLVRIQRNGAHLLSLINNILNFAKLEAGRIELDIADMPLNETLAGVEALIRPQLEARGLRYEYQPGDEDVSVRADQEKLLQIILNLLTNAVKFTDAGGMVRLRWEATNGEVLICVDDTGSGIEPENLAVVFEPFVQVAERFRSEREGVGLGLAISRDLARAMAGELEAESEPGRGSTFTLRLPRGGSPEAGLTGGGG